MRRRNQAPAYPCKTGAWRPAGYWLHALVCACVLLFPAPLAHAQTTVTNPRIVSFIPSDDHNAVTASGQAVVSEYDMEIFLAGGAQPLVVLNLGKPTPASDGNIYVDFASLLASPPMPGVVLEARVAAVGPTGRGESTPSNRFQFDSASTPTLPPATSPNPAPPPSSPVPSVPSPEPAPATELVVPTLRVTAPASGAALRLGQWVMLAAASNGDVTGVDFYVNGAFAGTATRTPYRVAWSSRTTGRFTITAVTIANGVQVKSAPVFVTVSRTISPPRTPPAKATAAGAARARQ